MCIETLLFPSPLLSFNPLKSFITVWILKDWIFNASKRILNENNRIFQYETPIKFEMPMHFNQNPCIQMEMCTFLTIFMVWKNPFFSSFFAHISIDFIAMRWWIRAKSQHKTCQTKNFNKGPMMQCLLADIPHNCWNIHCIASVLRCFLCRGAGKVITLSPRLRISEHNEHPLQHRTQKNSLGSLRKWDSLAWFASVEKLNANNAASDSVQFRCRCLFN